MAFNIVKRIRTLYIQENKEHSKILYNNHIDLSMVWNFSSDYDVIDAPKYPENSI